MYCFGKSCGGLARLIAQTYERQTINSNRCTQTGKSSLCKKTSGSEENIRYNEEEIIGISAAFDDVPKTGNAAWAIAAILEHSRHHSTALTTLTSALGDLEDIPANAENFRVLDLRATIQKRLHEYEAAQQSITRALSHQDGISPQQLRRAYITQAEIYTNLENTDEAIISYEKARQADSTEPLRGKVLRQEFDAWNNNSQAVDLVKIKWTLHERLEWMTWNYVNDTAHLTNFMFAAIDANELNFIVETYEEIISVLDQFDAGVPLRNSLAQWYVVSSKNLDLAKTESLVVLDSTLNSNNSEGYRFTNEDPEFVMYSALSRCTDIIYQQFRSTADRQLKAKLFEEAKGLMKRPLSRAVVLQKSWQIHHKIVLATMARKLGPLHEFEDTLGQAFSDILEALTDDIAWNDRGNLDLLSRVLSSLNGLEREAKIALSARFSEIEVEDEGDASDKDGEQGSAASDSDDSDDDNDDDDDDDDDNDPLPEDEGDLTEDYTYCAGSRCSVSWRAWQGRRAYQCVYCWDMLLCEACYEKRMQYNNGATIPTGDHFCGKNHKYISGPVDGWKGIKDGMVMIEGQEPFSFKSWLVEMKEKLWREAWENFWMD